MKHSVLPQGREKLFNELRVERNAGLGTHVILNLIYFLLSRKQGETIYQRYVFSFQIRSTYSHTQIFGGCSKNTQKATARRYRDLPQNGNKGRDSNNCLLSS